MKIILSLILTTYVWTACEMQQYCDITDPTCKPNKTSGNQTIPFILKDNPDDPRVVCQEFLNNPSCCTRDQNILLKENFDSIDSIFGSKFGGCDICAINLKRFWCYFTCAPYQDQFRKHWVLTNSKIRKLYRSYNRRCYLLPSRC
jgi:hypothetical protein